MSAANEATPAKAPPPILLVTGNQAAGKTTVSRLLAERYERAVHVSGDVLQRMIVSGGTWPEPPAPTGEALRQLRLRQQHTFQLALSFHDAGFAVVCDDVYGREEVDHAVAVLRGRPVGLIVLAPSLGRLRERDEARATATFGPWAEILDRSLREGLSGRGLWVDSSEQTPEQTVDEVVTRLQEAVLRPR